MDIRRFFGSPPAKKTSSVGKVKETNNNNNERFVAGKKSEKTTTVNRKEDKKKREKSEDRKKDIDRKNKNEAGTKENRKSRKSSDEFTKIADKNESRGNSKKRKASSDKESSVKKKPVQVTLEDSDDDQEFEVIRKPRAKSGRKKGIVYDSDSEEEEPIPKKSKRKSSEYQPVVIVDSDDDARKKSRPSPLKAFMKKTPAKPVAEVKKKEEQVKRTPVSAADFFGGGSVKRVERRPASKRKLEEDAKTPDQVDEEIHDDADFEKTLAQLDEQSQKPKKTKTELSSPKKEASPSKSSLSSKLSSLAKSSKVIVEDTPERKRPPTPVRSSPRKSVSTGTPTKKVSTPERKRSPTPVRSSPRKSVSTGTPTKHQTPSKTDTTKTSPQKGAGKTSAKTPNKPESKKTSPEAGVGKASAKTPSPGKTPVERKGSTGYRGYLNREGPRSLGSKEIPEGEPNCLEGLTFVVTGVLESFERDETKSLLEKYGAKVTQSLSKKTSYIVVGRDAGESKLSKAEQFKTTQLDEDGMLDLIRTRPGKKSKYEIQAEAELKKERSKTPVVSRAKTEEKLETFKASSSKSVDKVESQSTVGKDEKVDPSDQSEPSLLWVDKYKPTSLKRIIGQTGDKSNANKLFHWLKNWHKNRALGKKPTGFFGKDDGSGHRAALLSGPPGVGKTTTATLVCQEVGFSYVELNASDTRSKKTLENVVSESLNNQTLVDFLGENKKPSKGPSGQNHCIIMDEVDGVAGNEDRGGIQELIQLIKQTRIPIICICNDRNHQKMRSLVNYCFDLRFYKPRVEQIKGAMMSIVFKEGLTIPPPALNEIILGANQDVRQVIHNLSMWCSTSKALTYEQAKEDSKRAKKDFKVGPFDVCRKVFVGGEETSKMTIMDKSDLFFNDYSIAPLFVQENYIHVTPYSARGDVTRHLSQLAKASDSICNGDLVEKKIRSQSKWGLLPMEAIFASVVPGEEMRGGISQMIAFPSWLGKNSSHNKHDRIIQELHTHMSLHISSDKRGLNLDYLPFLRKTLTDPLVEREGDGVRDVIELMDGYSIIKEDFDNVMEVTKWPNNSDPFASLSSKTKSAFTRAYNKESHMTPYSLGGGTKKKKGRGGGADESGLLGDEGEAGTVIEEEEEEDDMADGMIKVKKPTAATKKGAGAGTKGKQAADTKGKGRGKGKGKGKS